MFRFVRFGRFRVFFIACAEFFAMDNGETWGLGHYLWVVGVVHCNVQRVGGRLIIDSLDVYFLAGPSTTVSRRGDETSDGMDGTVYRGVTCHDLGWCT